ncbi:MAG: Na/Pi symporter [candidate division KSB1 bacterium]|nr:Na/Pi symporter [candidate division KSB1 bacterium]
MNPKTFSYIFRIVLLLSLLYLFFVSIALMSASIKMFGKGFAEQLLATTSSPFVGLFIGILATSLVQSSSTTTSMTVALVASGAIELQGAIPIIMGANVGTSVTNTLVALAHITRAGEFKKAFAAATMHDFFNLIAIIVLFPLNYVTNVLEILAKFLSGLFQAAGGLKFANPLKMATAPAVDLIKQIVSASGWIMLIIAVVFLLISLRYIVVTLKALVIGRVETFFNETLFKNAFRSFVIGLILTVMVQSSSITTSLAVPLASTGIFSLRQIFPYTLGANIGTTITAILASMVTANPIAVATAFAHLMFNMLGIILIWPVKEFPIWLAEKLADLAIKNRLIPLVYIVCVFFIIPVTFIFFLR